MRKAFPTSITLSPDLKERIEKYNNANKASPLNLSGFIDSSLDKWLKEKGF
jgi:hypothetical protein